MRTLALSLGLLLACTAIHAEEEALPEDDPLFYLHVNEQGAEEWYRLEDGAVVIRVLGGAYLKRPYEGWVATEDPSPVEVPSFFVDKHEITNAQFARFLNTRNDVSGLVKSDVPGLVNVGVDQGGWIATPGLERHPVTAATTIRRILNNCQNFVNK